MQFACCRGNPALVIASVYFVFLCVNLFTEYHIQLPDATTYVDIISCSQLPKVTFATINTYLQANEKVFDGKCKQLYEQRYIRFLRVAQWNNLYYISGVVWAEMRRQTNYKVDISLDTNSVVCEAQCECGAGQGPTAHCKHVTTVLYALCRLATDGAPLTEQTCTQVLQTFHQAKPYTGMPMKTTDLHALRGHNYIFDPRPADKINKASYPSHFRNTVLNFHTEDRMPVSQLFKPSNPYARISDHCYMSQSEEEVFIEQENITRITEEEEINLERQTVGQHNNSSWTKQHTLRLTSSKFGTICRATAKKDLSRLAEQLVSPRHFTCRSVQHGLKYEAIAVQQFEAMYGPTQPCGMFVCSETPWLAASPDRIVSDVAILEIKCPYAAKDKYITPATVPYLKEADNSLQLCHTHAYYYQVQGQLMCSLTLLFLCLHF